MKKNLILPLLLALSLPALADPIDDFAQAELERQKSPALPSASTATVTSSNNKATGWQT